MWAAMVLRVRGWWRRHVVGDDQWSDVSPLDRADGVGRKQLHDKSL